MWYQISIIGREHCDYGVVCTLLHLTVHGEKRWPFPMMSRCTVGCHLFMKLFTLFFDTYLQRLRCNTVPFCLSFSAAEYSD